MADPCCSVPSQIKFTRYQDFLVQQRADARRFFALVSFTPMVTIGLLDLFVGLSGEAYAPAEFSLLHSAIATLIMILTLDFYKYWVHYIHHEHPAL